MYKNTLFVLVLLCCVLGTKAQYNVDRLLQSGRVALHYEDYVLSMQYFNQAISQKPYLWEPWQLRAIAKYNLDDWSGAEEDATKAIELNPYVNLLYDLRGISFIRQEKFTEAIADYTKAIELEPANQNYWYNRVVCYMEMKDYDRANEELDTIIRKWKKWSSPYIMKAQVYLHQKDTLTATEWIDKSIAIDSYNADALRVRANLFLMHEEWEKAEEYYGKVLRIKPKDADIYINRALARLRQNKLRGAMEDYDTSLEISPSNFLAHYNRGLLRQQVGDDNRAIEDFDYVLSLEPENVMALFNRATLLDRTGDLRAAIRDYTKVINKFPNFWTGLRYRAECYRKLGQNANAEKDEFRILKAQMDKHLGIQNRWSRQKLMAMRKLSDVDPEKYNQLVVDDDVDTKAEYKSEYRGRVQNHKASEQYMPYIALTIDSKRPGITSYTPFDAIMDNYIESIRDFVKQSGVSSPVLGCVGEGMGISTFDLIDILTDKINSIKDTKISARLLLFRAIAYSSAQNYSDAIKDVDTYLDINPNSVVALWQKAVCEAMIAEYDNNSSTSSREADMRNAGVISDFNHLITISNENANVLYCLGTFHARVGNNKQAIDILSKAINIDNQQPYAYYNRGLAYMHSGDIVKAKQDFSKAGEMGIYSAYSLMKSQNRQIKK